MDRDDERDIDLNLSAKEWDDKKGKRYIERTKDAKVPKILKDFVRNAFPGKACELGSGSGNSSIFLLENDWKVTSYDINSNSKESIISRISDDRKEKFKFVKTFFEDIELEKENDLIVAFNSLSFCKKEYFEEFFQKIADSIKPGGYLIGNLFGNRHQYNRPGKEMTFFARKEVEELLSKYFLVDFENPKQFAEFEGEKMASNGEKVFWHDFYFRIMKKI